MTNLDAPELDLFHNASEEVVEDQVHPEVETTPLDAYGLPEPPPDVEREMTPITRLVEEHMGRRRQVSEQKLLSIPRTFKPLRHSDSASTLGDDSCGSSNRCQSPEEDEDVLTPKMRAKSSRVRATAKKARHPIRIKVTKLLNEVTAFFEATPEVSDSKITAMAKIGAFNNRYDNLSERIRKFDNEILESFDQATEMDEFEKETDDVQDYEQKLAFVDTCFQSVFDNNKHERDLELNRARIPPLASSTPLKALHESGKAKSEKFSGVKLPIMKLPEFAGDCLLWPSFIDRFMGVIDSSDKFPESYKLEYLKGCLKGEPARILQQLYSTDENYKIALEMLRSRYEDNWPIIVRYHETLNSFKALTGKSAKDLRRLHEVFTTGTQGLRNIGEPYEGVGLIITMAGKLDNESREEWEKEVTNLPLTESGRQTIPSVDQLFSFIDKRAKTLEHAGGAKVGAGHEARAQKKSAHSAHTAVKDPPKQQQSADSNATITPRVKPGFTRNQKSFGEQKAPLVRCCVHCKGAHAIWTCVTFAALTHAEKKKVVSEAKLCFNCLSVGHSSQACKSTYKCKTCQRRHHTLLHVADGAAGGS